VSFKNFENSLTTVKVMRKTKVAPFYLGHGVVTNSITYIVVYLLVLSILKLAYSPGTNCL